MDISPAPLRPPHAALPGVAAAQVVLPCTDLAATLAFFTDQLGFRVELISPADDPAVVVINGLGVRLRLQRVEPFSDTGAPASLILVCDDPVAVLAAAGVDGDALVAPNGTRIVLQPADPPLALPDVQQTFVLSRLREATGFHAGRAGMGYRDLIPDRQGGRFIASHIRIVEPGPVPDYVHFHQVRFQMIYCYRGWVKVVYEDQGEPFVMHAGDCVLQPPTIRHRVLESGDGLEVIELGCPAVHDTHADPTTSLPTGSVLPDRDYGNHRTGLQRFVRHIAAEAVWRPHRLPGYEHRDTGIAGATDGLAGARVLRPVATGHRASLDHSGEFAFWFVLDGSVTLDADRRPRTLLEAGDSVVIPAGLSASLWEPSHDLQLLEVSLPA